MDETAETSVDEIAETSVDETAESSVDETAESSVDEAADSCIDVGTDSCIENAVESLIIKGSLTVTLVSLLSSVPRDNKEIAAALFFSLARSALPLYFLSRSLYRRLSGSSLSV